jgi:hypothetical protein
LENLGIHAFRKVVAFLINTLPNALLQRAVVRDWVVEVWNGILENVFDYTLDDNMLVE